jgi:hypothetical protein
VAPAPDDKRKWYGLALRHCRIALRLLRSGFPDGAVFHTYHAYECIVSAFIAAQGVAVPPVGWTKLTDPITGREVYAYPSPRGDPVKEGTAHKARLVFFRRLADSTTTYYAMYEQLSRFLTIDSRNDALYYDAVKDRLPHQTYNDMSFATELLRDVRDFGREVWRAVR